MGMMIPAEIALMERLLPRFQTGGQVGQLFTDINRIGRGLGTRGPQETFNPFEGNLGGDARSTLQDLLTTGGLVDTSPLIAASQEAASETFGDLTQGINERFGALGLGSSSAREAELGRQARRLSSEVGRAGIEASVGAAESAAGRRLAALNPSLTASGQRLSATQARQELLSRDQDRRLQGQIARAGARGSATGSLLPATTGAISAPPTAPTASAVQPRRPAVGFGRSIGRRFQTGGQVVDQRRRARAAQRSSPAGRRREDFGDFLSQLLFGRTFTRPAATQAPAARGPGRSRRRRERVVIPEVLPPTPEIRADTRISKGRSRATAGQFGDVANAFLGGPRTFRQPGDVGDLASILRFIGPENAAAGLRQTGQLLSQFAEGGEIEGPSGPADRILVLAEDGEVILPVDTAEKLMRSTSKDPLIREMKEIAGRKPTEQEFQTGGQVSALQELLETRPRRATARQLDPNVEVIPGEVPGFRIEGTTQGPVTFEDPRSENARALEDVQRARARENQFATFELQGPATPRLRELSQRAREDRIAAEDRLAALERTQQPQVVDQTVRRQVQGEVEDPDRQLFQQVVGQSFRDPEVPNSVAAMNAINRLRALGREDLITPGLAAQVAQEQPVDEGDEPRGVPQEALNEIQRRIFAAAQAGQSVDQFFRTDPRTAEAFQSLPSELKRRVLFGIQGRQ